MRIVLLGSSSFSIPALEYLHNSKYQLVAVVTPIDKPKGRGKKISNSELGVKIKELSYTRIQIDDLNNQDNIEILNNLFADIFVVVAFQKLPDTILNIPKYGCINIHPSKLPKYRGASPLQYAIMNGEKKIGVSIIKLSSKIDSGNILYQSSFPISNHENFGKIYTKASLIGAQNLIKSIEFIESDFSYIGQKQEENNISYAKKIFSNDCIINWNESSINIFNKIRALSPYPGAYTFINKKRFKIFKARIINTISSFISINHLSPGDIIIQDDILYVKTKNSFLELLEVQIEGKKRLNISIFLKGNQIKLTRFNIEKT
tara:strand:+ start:200 stop:1153 length:954 start_codon:yes stop_codon:yes gene_type:complete